eukprot:730087_1
MAFVQVQKARDLRVKEQASVSQEQNTKHVGSSSKGNLIPRDFSTDVDLDVSVRKRDEPSGIVRRFTANMQGKSTDLNDDLSFDTASLEFVNRFAASEKRPARGIWSHYGRPYICSGEPDLDLCQQAQESFMSMKEKRTKKSLKRQASSSTSQYNGERKAVAATVKQKPVEKRLLREKSLAKTRMHADIMAYAGVPLHRETDSKKFTFPRAPIKEAEKRYTQSKNGVCFSKLIDEQAEELGDLFPVLQVVPETYQQRPNSGTLRATTNSSSKKTTQRQMRSTLSRTEKPRRTTVSNLGNQLEGRPRPTIFALSQPQHENTHVSKQVEAEAPILRWRREFNEMKESLKKDLDEQLARYKLDRLEVIQRPQLLSSVSYLASNRATMPLYKKNKNIWTEAKSEFSHIPHKTSRRLALGGDYDASKILEKLCQQAHAFYKSLRVFVECRWGHQIKNHIRKIKQDKKIDEIIEFVLFIKKLLEQGHPTSKTMFFESFRFKGHAVFDAPHLMEIMRFFRRHWNIELSEIQEYMYTMGWHFPASVSTFIMSKDDSSTAT